MTRSKAIASAISFARHPAGLAVLLALFVAVDWMSLAAIERSVGISHQRILDVLPGAMSAAGLIGLFLVARFGFGYLLGVSFYGMIVGFVWITYFSEFKYDHTQARWSAIASLLLFLLPVLFVTRPLKRTLSPKAMNRLLVLTLGTAVAVLGFNAYYGVAFVGIREAEQLRGGFPRPTLLNYVTGSTIGAVLPFAFAYFAMQRRYWMAAATILLLVCFYPVLLTKTVLFAAIWLPFVFFMFRTFDPKAATVLSDHVG